MIFFLLWYLDRVAGHFQGLVTNEEVEIVDAFRHPTRGLIANFGRFLDGNRRRNDVLRLFVTRIAQL